MSHVPWTWSPYSGGSFGLGMVVCRGEAAARIWLPAKRADSLKMMKEMADFFTRMGADRKPGGAAESVARRIEAYLTVGGDLSDIPLHPPEGSTFNRRVLEACHAIPYGQVITYRDLAERAGNVLASRAAGTSMARNPLPLLVPCHRVIRTDGGLGNYGGGERMKRRLLEIEGATVPKRSH